MSTHVERYCPRCRRSVQWGKAQLHGHKIKSCKKCGTATKPREPRKMPRALRPMGWRRTEARANGDLTQEQWSAIIAFYGGRCSHCEEKPWSEMEHFLPIAKGGQYTAANVGPSCHACNQRKGRQTWWPRRRHPFMEREAESA